MKSTPFNKITDYPPIPFDQNLCDAVKKLKESGLDWTPHVGCFVWDEEDFIPVPSPFPNNFYFILNLNHFIKIFNQIEMMKEKMVWLPTDYQAQILAIKLNVEKQVMQKKKEIDDPVNRLIALYDILIPQLSQNK